MALLPGPRFATAVGPSDSSPFGDPAIASAVRESVRPGPDGGLLDDSTRLRLAQLTIDDFNSDYGLDPGQLVRRVAPPYPDSRLWYYWNEHSGQAQSTPGGPDNIFLRDRDGRVTACGMAFSVNHRGTQLNAVLRFVARLHPHELQGDISLLKNRIPGDFVVRSDASDEAIVTELEGILRGELGLPIHLNLGTALRETLVARGEYLLQPYADDRPGLHVVPDSPDAPRGCGVQRGDINALLGWLSGKVEQPVVTDLASLPEDELAWYAHHADSRDRLLSSQEALLADVTEQTGLSFSVETRSTRILLVERSD